MVLNSPLEKALINHVECLTKEEEHEVQTCIKELDGAGENSEGQDAFQELKNGGQIEKPKVELKTLPAHLKYVFLEDNDSKPVIISSSLKKIEDQLVKILKRHKAAIGWHISDLQGISPSYCMHKINMEADYKPVREPQRRLNPIMKEEMHKEIVVDPKDQEKTAFTYPFGVFAYRHMPFGLCNAPATFQRCIMAIFSDMVEKCIEVFMDDFSIFGPSFKGCLLNLERVLQRCEESNLVLNWEKFHFMVQEGIVLGHKISVRGIEVDKAKIDVIEKLPPPMNAKEVRSFL
ncbi:uncharacterized protein [Glycine max]|uniref:uncharacterized protein n=1 Tax=Glycine max TaxID=3847 RepID=UPI00071924A7|nr:uncharacterized protein LOC106796946 [Glycine max]|eukprot:XP_014626075.1 uncharacterized protein LOC106796946 [Glycine max]